MAHACWTRKKSYQIQNFKNSIAFKTTIQQKSRIGALSCPNDKYESVRLNEFEAKI